MGYTIKAGRHVLTENGFAVDGIAKEFPSKDSAAAYWNRHKYNSDKTGGGPIAKHVFIIGPRGGIYYSVG